jgi:2-dehydro-3-deoxyphosphogluconate aldolase/(4S)-4-hydroxy-2-oxoglutarate aldolase
MGRFAKYQIVSKIIDSGLIPIFYQNDLEVSKKIVQACVDGGSEIVEFTNRGDLAYEVFVGIAKWCADNVPQVALGVGSVVDPGTAALYINSGANFVVSPIVNAEVAKICNRRQVAYLPGCGTVSEISAAEELGAELIKIFPGEEMGGPKFIKDLLGPIPWAKIVPTGGVDTTWESVSAWIQAGAASLGIGSRLISKEMVAAGNYDGIRKKVEDSLGWVKKARGTPLFLGVEHVGVYPTKNIDPAELATWYAETFGFKKNDGTSSFFLSGKGPGRIEIMKEPSEHPCHIAVKVSNFEEACKYLADRGIEVEEPKLKKAAKAVFLKSPDKVGNRIQLINHIS